MSVALGALLSAVAGAITGFFGAQLRDEPAAPGAVAARAIAGGVIAAMAYGVFLIAGLAVGVLTFSMTLEPWPALIATVVGCVGFVVVRMVHSTAASHFGMPERLDRSKPRSFDDLLDARAGGGASTMWLLGVAAALLPISYGIKCIVTRQGELGTTLFRSTVEGIPAVALGVGWIGVGLFLHCHFFFGLHPSLHAHSRWGKVIAVMIACAGLMVAYGWAMLFGNRAMAVRQGFEPWVGL